LRRGGNDSGQDQEVKHRPILARFADDQKLIVVPIAMLRPSES